MRVEVLYVAACPSHPAAVKLVREVLSSEGVAAEIREVMITDDRMARGLCIRWLTNDPHQRTGRGGRVFPGKGDLA